MLLGNLVSKEQPQYNESGLFMISNTTAQIVLIRLNYLKYCMVILFKLIKTNCILNHAISNIYVELKIFPNDGISRKGSQYQADSITHRGIAEERLWRSEKCEVRSPGERKLLVHW